MPPKRFILTAGLLLALAGCSPKAAVPSSDPVENLNKARKLMESGRYEDALLYLNQALAVSPRDPEVHLNLGWLYLYTNEPSRTRDELAKANGLAPDAKGVHHLRGALYAHLDQHEDAVASYRQALEKTPDSAKLYFDLATSQAALNEADAALSTLDEGFEHIPERDLQSQVNYMLASCAYNSRLKRFEAAIADCRHAAEFTSSEDARLRIEEMIHNMQLIQDIEEDMGEPAGQGNAEPAIPGPSDQVSLPGPQN